MQARATFPLGPSIPVDLWILNVGEQSQGIGAFGVTIAYTRTIQLSSPEPASGVRRFVEATEWRCANPSPTASLRAGHRFSDDDPTTEDAYIGCARGLGSGSSAIGGGDVRLASFTVTGNAAGKATIKLHGNASGSDGALLVDCSVPTRCLGAAFKILPQNE
jgi:hypothetical protein